MKQQDLIPFLNRVLTEHTATIDEWLEFIEYVNEVEGDCRDLSQFSQLFQQGMGNQVIQHYLDLVRSKPNIYKAQFTDVIDRNGRLIKTIVSNDI